MAYPVSPTIAFARAGTVIIDASTSLAAATVGVLSGYLAVVTASALVGGSQLPDTSTSATSARRFVIAVPAHNEEAVIERALQSFRDLDYPPAGFEVHVVADNCTDQTSAVVRRLGYAAHDRTDPAAPGKGPALNWLFDRLVSAGTSFDSLVIVDADTTLHPAFLQEMAVALDGGHQAAQGFYGVRDVGESIASSLRYAALTCRHHLRPLGRARLGGSSGLYGNGMAFDRSLMMRRRWSGHLTEDMEFQMELLLDGHKIAYVPGAMLEAEMPGSLDAATSQNERWELGRIQMAKRYVPALVGRILHQRGRRSTAEIDAVFDHLVPPLSVLVAANGVVGVGALALRVLRGSRLDRVNLVLSAASSAVLAVHVVAGLRSVRAPRSVYRSLLQAPRMIVWKTALWARVLVKPDDVSWTRTTRNNEQP